MKTKYNKGFTLVELLVVIAIIGILASVVLVSLNSARGKARDARRVSDLHQIALALENYYDANGSYPTALTGLSSPPAGQNAYLTTVPTDPQNGAVYTYGYKACGGAPDQQKYVLKAVLENHQSSLDSDIDGSQCTEAVACGTQGSTEREYCIMP